MQLTATMCDYETKYRTESDQYIDDVAKYSVLNMTKCSGKQMSDKWIGSRIEQAVVSRAEAEKY